MYTIKFKANDQDNLNIIPFKVGDKMPSFLDFDKVLASSIKQGYIKSKSEIKTLVDGSDHIEPYFTSEDANAECAALLDQYDPELFFSAMEPCYQL